MIPGANLPCAAGPRGELLPQRPVVLVVHVILDKGLVLRGQGLVAGLVQLLRVPEGFVSRRPFYSALYTIKNV